MKATQNYYNGHTKLNYDHCGNFVWLSYFGICSGSYVVRFLVNAFHFFVISSEGKSSLQTFVLTCHEFFGHPVLVRSGLAVAVTRYPRVICLQAHWIAI